MGSVVGHQAVRAMPGSRRRKTSARKLEL